MTVVTHVYEDDALSFIHNLIAHGIEVVLHNSWSWHAVCIVCVRLGGSGQRKMVTGSFNFNGQILCLAGSFNVNDHILPPAVGLGMQSLKFMQLLSGNNCNYMKNNATIIYNRSTANGKRCGVKALVRGKQ